LNWESTGIIWKTLKSEAKLRKSTGVWN